MSIERRRQTLLALLDNCFKLRAHRETGVMPVYEMTKVSSGPNLRRDAGYDAGGPIIKNESGSVRFRNTTMDEFAKRLSEHLDRPVVDKTGAGGILTISLDWAPTPREEAGPEEAGSTPGKPMPITENEGSPIPEAIQQQLGLRFVQKQGPVEVIVIEQAERPKVH